MENSSRTFLSVGIVSAAIAAITVWASTPYTTTAYVVPAIKTQRTVLPGAATMPQGRRASRPVLDALLTEGDNVLDSNPLVAPTAAVRHPSMMTVLSTASFVVVAAVAAVLGRWAPRRSGMVSLSDAESGVMMAATGGDVSRRSAIQTAALVAAFPITTSSATAAGIPAGFNVHKDPYDGYQFLFPFGWQELKVEGQDVLYKDVIEPLESISVSITPTNKESITELGDVNTVCEFVADKFLTGTNQQVTLLDAKADDSEGITYYTMEFLAKSNYTRHALAAMAISNGKLMICLTGCNEKRWNKIEKNLRTAIDSFTVFKVVKTRF